MKSYKADRVEDTIDSPEAISVTHEASRDEGWKEERESEDPRSRSRFRLPPPPSREQLLRWAPFWGIILLGAVLRFWGLGDKPLHHDESLHAYFSLQLMHNLENWSQCIHPPPGYACYQYDPLLHGPFQFHAIALVYKISQLLGVYDHGVNTFTVRIAAATLGTVIVGLPYFLRDYLGKVGAWIACFLLAVSPSLVYFSRFAREDIYMACFTLLLVVAIVRYLRSRRMRWLVIAAAAFILSYATKEATFLTIAVFGSFFGALLAWELGLGFPLRSRLNAGAEYLSSRQKSLAGALERRGLLPRTTAPMTLLAYLLVVGVAAKVLFSLMKSASIYITANQTIADQKVHDLKMITLAIVPFLIVLFAVYVLTILAREFRGKQPPGRRGLAARIDPEKQHLLNAMLTMPWIHWFVAILCGLTIFLVLFTVLFTNVANGIGDGIWQGLYYWLEQQQVARGGQPWYYYLMLIPLYEQIGVVFGLVGLVRCLVRPSRFRLFLVYWFVGNLLIYSWAAEKMPWLSIHIVMPMLLLAALGLEPLVLTLVNLVKSVGRSIPSENRNVVAGLAPARLIPELAPARLAAARIAPAKLVPTKFAGSAAIVGVVMAVLLLLPTLHNMYEVSQVHAADGPHEMLIYVQTTTDVNKVMQKIDALDQKLYGGKHLLAIGVMNDAVWPFVWYLRDYSNVCLYFPSNCPSNIPVIIAGGDNLYDAQAQYAGNGSAQAAYLSHQYHMRTWWDEGYKPPACVPSRLDDCADQPSWGGVGPGLWLSYGDTPPAGAKFNLGLAATHLWQWWWDRRPIGSTSGAYDMGLFIRNDLGVTP